MKTVSHDTIFTNVALTTEGGVWWEGMTDEPPEECLDWQGKRWTPQMNEKRRGALFGSWQKAVGRSLDWVD